MDRAYELPGGRILRRTFLGGLVTSGLGVVAAGCGSKSGRQVAPGSSSANLTVTNNSPVTIDVHVDYAKVGEVQPGSAGYFQVLAGIRAIHVRERGESFYRYYGDFVFDSSSLLGLTYWPGHTRNLVVQNDGVVTIDLYVDGIEVASVRPGERRDLFVSPGRRDLHVRERGDSSLTFVGTFDFPPAGSGIPEITVIYG